MGLPVPPACCCACAARPSIASASTCGRLCSGSGPARTLPPASLVLSAGSRAASRDSAAAKQQSSHAVSLAMRQVDGGAASARRTGRDRAGQGKLGWCERAITSVLEAPLGFATAGRTRGANCWRPSLAWGRPLHAAPHSRRSPPSCSRSVRGASERGKEAQRAYTQLTFSPTLHGPRR